MTGLTRHLAEFALGFRSADSPGADRAAVDFVIDALGAGAHSATRPFATKIATVIGTDFPSGAHGVLGGGRTSAQGAAWANAALMHAEDFDDTPHTSYYLPALLTEAERRRVTGAELVDAWAMSYELWMSLAAALRPDRPLNPTALFGAIAGAAGVGRLRGLDADGIARAMSVAASAAVGLRGQFGTDMKADDAGRAAAIAVRSVDLVLAGWTADSTILERDNGWLATFGPGGAAVPPLGETFPRVGRPPRAKAWPCCARHVGVLAVLEELVPQAGGTPVTAVEVEVGFEPARTAVFRSPAATPLQGKFSIEYVAAAACLDGTVTAATFDDETFARIRASGLPSAVSVRTVPEFAGSDGAETAAATLSLADGRTLRAQATGAGWLDSPGIGHKFLTTAGALLGPDHAAELLAGLTRLSDQDDVGALVAPLFPATHTTPISTRERETVR